MTKLADMLTPEQIQAMKEALAPKVQTPAIQACTCAKRNGFNTLPGTTLAVCAGCGWPTERALQVLGHVYAQHLTPESVAAAEPARVMSAPDLPSVTEINGVEVDLRSDGFHETECADCGTPLQVEIKPKGVDLELLTSKPRVAVCEPCGRVRVKGKRGTLIHHQPTTQEENHMDLTEYSDAELTALVLEARKRMVAEAAAEMPAKAKKAKKAKAKAKAVDKALKIAEKERRVSLGQFCLKGVTVPALDLADVDLDEGVSAKLRSPYNKALYRLSEPLLDKEATTYRALAEVHRRLWDQAEGAMEAPESVLEEEVAPKKGKQGKKAKRLLADIDADSRAKVEAFASVTGKTFDEARKHLAALSLI